MLNTDKVRGVMRAKYGSQIPKFQIPSGPLVLEQQNPFKIGSYVATPKNAEKLENPIGEQREKEMELARQAILNTTKNQKRQQRLARGLARGTHMVSNGEVVLDGKRLMKNIGSAANSVIDGIGSFAKNNPNIASAGLDALGGWFNSGITNNSGTEKIFGLGDTITNGLMMVNPVAGLIGKGVMTAAKGINNLFGSTTDNFSADQRTIEEIGGSYGGSIADINEAASKAGKKYGLFSSGSRRAADRLIDSAAQQQSMMIDIADDARDQRSMINDLNYLNYDFNLSGGYDQRYMRAAKSGMKLQDKINFIKQHRINTGIINLDTKEIDWEPEVIVFKTGGIIESDYDIIFEIPKVEEFQKGGKTRTLEELIEYAKKENPRFIQRLSEDPRGIKFIDDEGNDGEGSHYLEWSTDDFGNAVIYPRIQEIEDGSLKFFPSNEAYQRAVKAKNILIMSPEEANTFFSEDPEYKTAYKRGWPSFFKLFKDGGKTKEELETPEIEETNQKNLIPEGALHKNKHHMEHTEGLTQKGIPVIDNEGEQQAEIELDEIIFTLEVTKKLEELYKDGSDESAIEAGKLLVKEILFNTDDRTGLISKCEKGGKL